MITRYVTLPLLRQSAHEMPPITLGKEFWPTREGLTAREFASECRNERIEHLLFAMTDNLDSSL